MLDMCPPGQYLDLYIGQCRTCQHTLMLPLLDMRCDQSLPVAVKHILAAHGFHGNAAPRLPRSQQQMYLRVVAQRLKMSDTLHRCRDCLLVYNASRSEPHHNSKTVLDAAHQHLHLNQSHQLYMDLPQFFIPYHIKLWIFFLQQAHVF